MEQKPRNGYGRLKVKYDRLMTNYNIVCKERDELVENYGGALGYVSSLTSRLGKKDALCRELWRALGYVRRKVWIYKHKGEKPV